MDKLTPFLGKEEGERGGGRGGERERGREKEEALRQAGSV